jgi:hypothetical protein
MMRDRLLSFALAVPLSLAAASPARAWEFVSTMNAYGDAATGIVQPSRNVAGAILAVGCDGDRWRLVAVGPPAGGGIVLDPEGEVRLSFGAERGPKGTWQVRKRGKSNVAYLAPAPSELVRQMLGREDASADAVLRVDVRSKHKPVTLEFPLAGLRTAIRKDLWEPCKLSNYIPESEFDRK